MRILLVVYDNQSYMSEFPIGLAYISSVLKKEGHEVEIYNQDIYHYPDAHLTEHLNRSKYDIVGISVIGGYYQYRKLLSLSYAINNSQNRPFYIIGGHGPAPEPEYFIRKTEADAVCIGEGEETIVELINTLENKQTLKNVLGIAYRDGKNIVINNRRPLIKDIDNIPFPDYESFPVNIYRLLRMPHCSAIDFVMPILSGRGCTFKCNFCYRMDEGFRPRSIASIIEEIHLLKSDYNITYVYFNDELLMSSVGRTISLCEAFIKNKINIKWNCNGRLNYAKKNVLKIMKEAGCVFINYGIESFDDKILRNMNKALTTRQITSGIEATLEAGISPGFNIIFGNIGEDRDILMKGVDFLLQYDDGSQMRTIRPVTPYPGSPLYYYAIEKGLLKDCEDFYANKHVNSDLLSVNFTNMCDDDVHQALLEANSRLIQNYFNKKMKGVIEQADALYLGHNVNFRGFRQI
jgi:anaerobic magnesium-protoporphyrin IX monomethyl ester cyclase